MYNVNGIKAIRIRVVSEREDALVEAEVDEDDSKISLFPPYSKILTSRTISEQQALYQRYHQQYHPQQYM